MNMQASLTSGTMEFHSHNINTTTASSHAPKVLSGFWGIFPGKMIQYLPMHLILVRIYENILQYPLELVSIISIYYKFYEYIIASILTTILNNTTIMRILDTTNWPTKIRFMETKISFGCIQNKNQLLHNKSMKTAERKKKVVRKQS